MILYILIKNESELSEIIYHMAGGKIWIIKSPL